MDISSLGIGSVAVITVICFLVGQLAKASNLNNKWIPIICGGVGGILGVIALYVPLADLPANDPMTAFAVGIVSGLAATGINQVYKQLKGE